MLGDAVLGAVSVKSDVTQAIAFRGRKSFYQRETLAKRPLETLLTFDRQHAAPQSRENGLDKIHQNGRHSERILLILLNNKCLPESFMTQ